MYFWPYVYEINCFKLVALLLLTRGRISRQPLQLKKFSKSKVTKRFEMSSILHPSNKHSAKRGSGMHQTKVIGKLKLAEK